MAIMSGGTSAAGGTSGDIDVRSAPTEVAGKSGDVSIRSGDGVSSAGAISVRSGISATKDSGSISIVGGTSTFCKSFHSSHVSIL